MVPFASDSVCVIGSECDDARMKVTSTNPKLVRPPEEAPKAAAPKLPKAVRELVALAQKSPAALQFRRDRPLSQVTNAHRTNTVGEMKAALKSDHTQFECDLRAEINPPHEIECRHDPGMEVGDNLKLSEWLAIGKASGRMLKLDVKESNRLPDILREVAKSGVPPERLNINLGDTAMDRYGPQIRRKFPGALLSINPKGADAPPLTKAQLGRMQDLARKLGPPCSFVLRNDLVTKDVAKTLEPLGPISIWNDPGQAGVDVPAKLERQYRAMGVTGIVDLRKSDGLVQKAEGVAKQGLGRVEDLLNRFLR
ncbi:MAG: hypothetical protein U0228_33835 [Myxococcaceae bacterium]